MQLTVGIGLIGCGTVGAAVAERIIQDAPAIERRTGVRAELRAVAIRNLQRERPPSIEPRRFTRDARAVIDDPLCDVVIEAMGGVGEAADLVEHALDRGRHVITANKDLIATQGPRLIALAASRGVALRYEAAACSAVPVVRTIADALAGDRVYAVAGVLNGTTTSILSAMEDGAEYEEALAEAQRLGYAEADPVNDVGGVDAAHKLALLLQLAFETAVISPRIRRSGIAGITREETALAHRLGYHIRLIAAALRTDSGARAEVAPVLVHEEHPFAQTRSVENIVRIDARDAGTLLLSGLGAGGPASASAVLGDLITTLREMAQGRDRNELAVPRFEPAIEIVPFFDGLPRRNDLPDYPVWDDAFLTAPASQASLAYAWPGKGIQ